MRSIIRFFIITFVLSLASWGLYGAAKHFWRGPTMSTSDVAKKWGSEEFKIENFKNASISEKAKMASSLLKNQKNFIGKDRSEIRELLGPYDGFYFSDMFPTYIIQRGKTHQEETWQVVFLLDKNEKISEIIVHKNCCDN